MSQAENYTPPVSQLLTLGECEAAKPWLDYATLGLAEPAWIPQLIRMALDRRLHRAESDSPEVWAPLHALRALGQMRATDAILPLMKLLDWADREEDDWLVDDLPRAYGLFGPSAIQPLAAHLTNERRGQVSRGVAAASLTRIALAHPETREQCVAILVRQLERFSRNPKGLNRELVDWLTEHLEAWEAEPLIERAIAARRVEDYTLEDWAETLELMRPPEPPPKPSRTFWRWLWEKLRLASKPG